MLLASQLPDTFLLVAAGLGSLFLPRILRRLRVRFRARWRPQTSDD
jgi:hypothetical protein